MKFEKYKFKEYYSKYKSKLIQEVIENVK